MKILNSIQTSVHVLCLTWHVSNLYKRFFSFIFFFFCSFFGSYMKLVNFLFCLKFGDLNCLKHRIETENKVKVVGVITSRRICKHFGYLYWGNGGENPLCFMLVTLIFLFIFLTAKIFYLNKYLESLVPRLVLAYNVSDMCHVPINLSLN